MSLSWSLIRILVISHLCHAYVDFGEATRVKVVPTASIPWPHQLPLEWRSQLAIPQHPMITAIAPFLTMHDNGTQSMSWSTTYHQYYRHFQNARGVFKRQNGVFQSDTSLLATCTPCVESSGASTAQTASAVCSTKPYSGVLAGTPAASAGEGICYGSNYSGALSPTSISTGLPCCQVCTPVSTATGLITSGVLATSTGTAATITSVITVGVTTTIPIVTIGVTTITGSAVAPAINTITGCGTASGSGTVIGSGTVYIGPGGLIPVTSSGTVSGFASKVIGCGTILATTGSFQGSGSLTGCGTGTGCAVLTGIGTVYPNALGGLIAITSSGVASGCGKVIGCGTLIGSGTFHLDNPITATNAAQPTPTVEVYISYCPPDPLHRFQLASNFTALDAASAPRYLNHSLSSDLGVNATANSTVEFNNPLCQLCPEDSGICCPLYETCGADGHCPFTALQRAGYTRFDVNVVADRNSSVVMGMEKAEGRFAPGLPGRDMDGLRVVRRGGNVRHGHGHGRGWWR